MRQQILACCTILLLASCSPLGQPFIDEGTAPDPVQVQIQASASQEQSRSAFGWDEVEIADFSVFAYCEGLLYESCYAEEPSLSLTLESGRTYTLYSLANTGKCTPPALESEIGDMRLSFPGMSGSGMRAIPMVSSKPLVIVPGSSGSRISVVLDRLVAKYSISIDSKLVQSRFKILKASLHNTALDVTPFTEGSTPLNISEGDSSSSADCDVLAGGAAASFYLLENCQGTLLPGNADASLKLPSSIGDAAQRCSYIELYGEWETAGASGALTYRIYLGKDNCSNFDVVRNTSSIIKLSITDDGTLNPSWKVEVSGLNDSRTLAFASDELVVWQGGTPSTCEVIIESGDIAPGEVAYSLICDPDEKEAAGLDYSLSDGLLSVSTSYVGTEAPEARIILSSWDGRKRDTLTVKVAYIPGTFNSYSLRRTTYAGEWGCFNFPTASSSSPVTFSVGSSQLSVGESGSKSFYHSPSKTMFYYVPSAKSVYFHSLNASGSGSCTVHLKQSTLETEVYLAPTRVAPYKMEDIVLNEAGTDYEVYLCLSGPDGEAISLDTFAKPDELIRSQGGTPDEYERFTDFADLYAGNILWEWKGQSDSDFSELDLTPNWGMSLVDDVNSCPEICREGNVAVFNMWGLEASADRNYDGVIRLKNDSFDAVYSITDVPLTVTPAFPSQRYLGEILNCQIAPGAKRCNTAAIPFGSGGNLLPYGGASWTVYDASFDPAAGEAPSLSMKTSSERHLLASVSGAKIHFSTPDSQSFPVCGSFLLEGSISNAHSGRTIKGYYSLDISLYMTVGVQVDFSGYDLLYSFVPFCEFASHSFEDLWNDNFPQIRIRSAATPYEGDSYIDTFMKVPGRAQDNTCCFTLNNPLTTGSVDICCSVIDGLGVKGLFNRFSFVAGGEEKDFLILNREGYASIPEYSSEDFVRGKNGYYRIYRQFSVASIQEVESHRGLDNLLVEPHLGSFVEY